MNHSIKVLIPILILLGLFSCNPETATPPKEIKQYSIDEFYNNISLGGGRWSNDESKLLIHSNETGIYNLQEIDIATGETKQVTENKAESFYAVDYVPGTNDLLYSADKGGNEISHIYLLKEDGSTTDLTPGETEKANFAGWTKDKKSMYYMSNKRDSKFFDMYKMNIADWTSEMIYKNEDGNDISDISWDENIIAKSKTITTSSNQLFLYDKTTKKTTEISAPDTKEKYNGQGFSKDGKYFYYLTTEGSEFTYLVQYEIATGVKTTIFETNWDVMYSYLSENEKYRIIGINEDGKNAIKLIDMASGAEVEFPEIDGDVLALSMSDSEDKIRLSVGSSKSPNNIYYYNLKSKELKKLTNSLNPNMNADDLVSSEVVRYKSFDGLEIPAIYYKPLTATKDNKVPALVWVHGGPGGQSRTGYFSLIQYLVNHGYAVLAVNNRGSSGYGKSFYKMDDRNHGDKDLKDCIYGKKWLQSQDYIDGEKIGIIGGSYGGYMTMAAMTFTPDEFEVGVNIFGVTNWLRTLKSIPPYWESFREALYAELGDPNTADSTRLYEISPVFHGQNVKNPVMVLQGANDPRVLKIESDEIVEAVKKNNVPVEYVVFDDEGHGFRKKENEKKGYSQILTFLDKYLKQVEVKD